jgi:hypothetical protein
MNVRDVGDVRIVEDVGGGYFVKVKLPGETGYWSKRYCLTLCGARRIARRMQRALHRGLYEESVKW